MQEPPKKRFIVFISLNDKDYMDVSRCDTMQEANDILTKARHTATGYAIIDWEKGEIVKKNNLFDPTLTSNF